MAGIDRLPFELCAKSLPSMWRPGQLRTGLRGHTIRVSRFSLGTYRIARYPITAKAKNARTAMIIPIRDIRLSLENCSSISPGRWGRLRGSAKLEKAPPLRNQPESATSSLGLDSLQMQRLRFAGAYDRHHLDIHHVGLPTNCESPSRYL